MLALARPAGRKAATLLAVPLLLTTLICAVAVDAAATEPRPTRKGRSRTVSIESAPPQAAIYLDDERYGVVGYTPWKGRLVEGAYKLILVKEGFVRAEVDIVVDRKNTRFVQGLERDLRAFISISAASTPDVQGAAVRIDGQARGTAPVEVEVTAGRHQIELLRDGFEPFSQWVDLEAGQKLVLAPSLKAKAAAPGSILVDANVAGAAVRIDGRGHPDPTPTVVENVAPGAHVVEVSVANAPAWKGTVEVRAGERAKVMAEIAVPKAEPEAPTTGSLLLDADQPGARAQIDGKALPEALPTVADGLAPGPHVVTVDKPGFLQWKQAVTVVAGARNKVSATLVPVPTKPAAPVAVGTLRVRARDGNAPVKGADVLLDGRKMGVSPLDIRKVAAGPHAVAVRTAEAAGEAVIIVKADELVEVAVALTPGHTLSAVALGKEPPSAAAAQATPAQKPATQMPSTPPAATPPAQNPAQNPAATPPAATPLAQNPGAPNPPDQPLAPPTGADPAGPLAEPISRMPSSWGARVLPYGALTLDLGLGYPWYVDLRGSAGLIRDSQLALDTSIHIRSSFLRTEGLLTMRFRLADGGPFAAAVFGSVGGGTGTAGRNSFTFQAGISGSVFFGDRAALSVRALIDTWSDRLCAERGSDEFQAKEGPDVCYEDLSQNPDREKRVRDLLGSTNVQERDGGLRLTVGTSLEIAISARTNIYLSVETSPAQAERATFTPLFHEAMAFTEDPVLAGRAGLTFKF